MSLRQNIRQQNEQQMFGVACAGDGFWCSSACLELDQTAQIISYEEYHPFGTTSYRSGRTETEVNLKRYKYVGKERDEETGLYYNGARYYAAWLCKFVSVDPLQFEYPYYTPYQYAGNKPISYIDLDGLEEAKPKGINPELSEESGDGLQNNNGSKLNENPSWGESKSKFGQNIFALTDIAYEELSLYMFGEFKKGKGKRQRTVVDKTLIEPAFVNIINSLNSKRDTVINFTTNFNHVKDLLLVPSNDVGGTIAYSGKNDQGKDVYWVYWDSNAKKQIGASGIFEESYHMLEAIEGIEMKFAKNSGGKETGYGLDGLDVFDETRAKLFVVENIKSITKSYEENSYKYRTHYGQVMEATGADQLATWLIEGVKLTVFKKSLSSEQLLGSPSKEYMPTGFSGGYKYLQKKKLYPK